MRSLPRRIGLACLVSALSACAADPPPPTALSQAAEPFGPAPMPSVRNQPRGSSFRSLQYQIPPKMPPGTGAVPVSSSPVRGSLVTGFHEPF